MKKLIFLFVIAFIANTAFSQVGINTENPNKLSELDIQNIINGTDTVPKGIFIPRMSQQLRDQIDVTSPSLANGLMVFNTDEDCYNYYSRTNQEWISLCGAMGKSTFGITDCSSISVSGEYLSNVALDNSNYIALDVNVTKVGTYSMTALPEPANGYYFSASGQFLSTGAHKLILQGAGTPSTYTSSGNGDSLVLSLNNVVASCNNTFVKVNDSSKKAMFIMMCSRTEVVGTYLLDTSLSPSANYIRLTLDVHPDAEGAFYNIETDEVDGIKFAASGYLQKGIQEIQLNGSGKPTSVGNKTFVIKSNSVSNSSTCQATLAVSFTKKTILTLGYKDAIFDINNSGSGANKLISNTGAFGTSNTSLVQTSGFTISSIGGATGPASTQQLKDALAAKPDIVIMTFDVYIYADQATEYMKYLNAGGVILAYNEGNVSSVEILMKAMFPTQASGISQARINAAGAVYALSSTVNDEIINGPFGDLRGKHWGEDRSQTAAVSGLPTSLIDIYSTGATLSGTSTGNATQVTAFKHKSLNFMWVGDGGFMAYLNTAATTEFPFILDASNYPAPYLSYGLTTKYTVYNSAFYANALAWAIKQATQNGINSTF